MASTIDSGIDTGNDSNDSSFQDKLLQVNFEMPPLLNSFDSSNESNPTVSLVEDKAHTSISSKVNEPSNSASLIHCPGPNYQLVPPPDLWTLTNVMSSSQVREILASPYGHEYARDLVTKVRHNMRSALRIRCMRRSSCLPGFLNYPMFKERLRMSHAVINNCTNIVRALLMEGVSPNYCDNFKRTPLHMAACSGYGEMVKLLLEFGADPNAKDRLGNTPLHLAACTNHVQVTSMLVEAGTRLGEKDQAGHSPLQLAITKLNILKRAGNPNPVLQEQITQVVKMMADYMKRKDHMEPALLSQLFSVMQVKDSPEEVNSNIQDLLSNLSLSSNS